jgi:phospholipid transport system transporter-binding protein
MLQLPPELTHEQAADCCRGLAQALRSEAGPEAVADASALRHFDSSAIAVLLECRRDALALGRRFSVRGLPPRLRALAVLYGVEQLLPAAP